jgi:hypothetical protein
MKIYIGILFLLTSFAVATTTTTTVGKSWFRENYMKQLCKEYYIHAFSRLDFDENNKIDNCPEVHKPAIYFAITGENLWSRTQSYKYQQRDHERFQKHYIHPRPPELKIMMISVDDFGWLLLDFVLYSANLIITLLSFIMALFTTLILYILIFEQ